MTYKNFSVETDADGIALVTWDMPGRSMNVLDAEVLAELSDIVERTTADEKIKGVVITSGKETFCAGADLNVLQSLGALYAKALYAKGPEAAAPSTMPDELPA
jgi:3-hydroxyacyl-CoA dehydrogenase/enoyl-CoA hydratase/3-hydroxybutyryl-CoA epimerase